MQAAVGEAGFMTGVEKKSDVVSMAAYAPLLVHANSRGWNPDMIVFDNHRKEKHLICTSYISRSLTYKYPNWHNAMSGPQEDPAVAETARCIFGAAWLLASKLSTLRCQRPHTCLMHVQGIWDAIL